MKIKAHITRKINRIRDWIHLKVVEMVLGGVVGHNKYKALQSVNRSLRDELAKVKRQNKKLLAENEHLSTDNDRMAFAARDKSE